MTKGVAVFGIGKVGVALAACLAKSGQRVIGVDVQPSIVAALNERSFRSGEPGVMERLAAASPDQIAATTDSAAAVAETNVAFVIVPTPSNTLGGFSNRFVLKACCEIGEALRGLKHTYTIAVVSTVMPGSSNTQIMPLLEVTSGRKIGDGLGYCYNPSFIALGEIVKGIERPDYLLVGESDESAGEVVLDIHGKMVNDLAPISRMKPVEAEITKIASNTHETMRVSFANMLLSICAEVPTANVDHITGALAHRMGRRFFKGATPYGGPCWPRDNQALAAFMEFIGVPSHLPRTVDTSNSEHGRYVLRKILDCAPRGSTVGIIGLAYKPGTPMIERSYSIDLINWLLAEGRNVAAWDPEAMDEAHKVVARASFCADAESCLAQSDVVVIALPLTQLPLIDWKKAGRATVIDCWRALPPDARASCAEYIPLGVGSETNVAAWINQINKARFELLTN